MASICNFIFLKITIPEVDTTYWCAAFKIPEEIRTQTRYVTKVSGVLLIFGQILWIINFVVWSNCD